MSRYWSARVHQLAPYVPGEQPKLDNLIKLNTNEHPHGPAPGALAAIRDAASEALKLYPDPESEQLRAALAEHFDVGPEQVFVGNGSDEVLAHTFVALLKQDKPLWFPDITYSFYPVYCSLYDVAHETVPLDETYRICVDDYLPSASGEAGGIIFANPNAPTGCSLSLNEIERIVSGNPQCVVVVDEAYVDFGGESAIALVARHPNLLVVQTFSKSRSLAGLRVGYAIGNTELIEALERVKNSFNSYPLDRLAQAGALASLQDESYFRDCCNKVITSRERLAKTLTELGFDVLPSKANFLFVRHPEHGGAWLASQLRERAIIVRHFSKPRINAFLRITVGTDTQCDALIKALREILENG